MIALQIFIVLVVLLFSPAAASAYLDPGSSSFIFQVLAASFLGFLLTFKSFWSKIKSLFTRRSSPPETSNEKTNKTKRT